MSKLTNDQVLLDQVLEDGRKQITEPYSAEEYFELFCVEQILKDHELNYDELESGLVDGGGDGGIDAFYTLVNGDLVRDDTDFSPHKKNPKLDVYIVQAKTSRGFREEAVNKLISATRDLLRLDGRPKNLRSVYNKDLLAQVELFRGAYTDLAGRFPSLSLHYVYATKADEVHPNVLRKHEQLEETVRQCFSGAAFSLDFLSARNLLDMARRQRRTSFQLELAENPISTGGANYICVVKLGAFYRFILAENGGLNRAIFESNVRDYQGRTEVNQAIYDTLYSDAGEVEDFWWLNNGVTAIATKATVSGKTLLVESPQIVNGLQTSTEVYRYFSAHPEKVSLDGRHVLVRVIVPGTAASGDRVIKATNSQTMMLPASLRATDQIQRDIEEFFLAHDLFYDRRKNFYKNNGKPISKVISIPALAQAVAAVVLQEPHKARAQPSSLLKKDSDYQRIFTPSCPLETYLVSAKVVRRVDAFLRGAKEQVDVHDRNNLKFHLSMFSAARALGKSHPTPTQISGLEFDRLTDELLGNCLEEVRSVYQTLGGNDRVAKASAFGDQLRAKLTGAANTGGKRKTKAQAQRSGNAKADNSSRGGGARKATADRKIPSAGNGAKTVLVGKRGKKVKGGI